MPLTPNSARPQNVHLDLSKSHFNLPLTFEANVGQAAPQVQFLARSQRSSFFLTNEGIDVQSANPARHGSNSEPLHITFSRAAPGAAHASQRVPHFLSWKGIDKLPTETNYLIGRKPHWHTHVPHYARAEAATVLPGLDVIAYNTDAQLEFDLRIAPSAKPDQLRLNISGAQDLRLSPDGDLFIQLAASQIRMRHPTIYEEIADRELGVVKSASLPPPDRTPIDGEYVLEPMARSVSESASATATPRS
jgi:hypothetical protein